VQKIFILMLILFPLSVHAEEKATTPPSCGTNCTYVIEGNTLTIKPIDETKEAKIRDYKDNCYFCNGDEVGDYSPWRFENITSVVIQNGITSIGDRAFEFMSTITSVDLPEGLKTIGNQAFNGCSILELNLPDSLEKIGNYGFSSTRASEIILPENLEEIGSSAFYNAMKLSSIVIPENTVFATNAFGILNEKYAHLLVIQNVYCSDTNISCQNMKNNSMMNDKVRFYQKDGNQIFYKNRWYNSANDILSGEHIKKRIFTIKEASKLSKQTGNSFKIRYK